MIEAALMHPWTPVYREDDVVGWVASGEFGYSVGAYIAHVFVPAGSFHHRDPPPG